MGHGASTLASSRNAMEPLRGWRWEKWQALTYILNEFLLPWNATKSFSVRKTSLYCLPFIYRCGVAQSILTLPPHGLQHTMDWAVPLMDCSTVYFAPTKFCELCIYHLSPQNNEAISVELFKFYRWWYGCSDAFSNFPTSRVAGIHTHMCLTLNHVHSTPSYSSRLIFFKETSYLFILK